MVLNLEEDNVGAALFGGVAAIGEGEVRRTGRIIEVPVGPELRTRRQRPRQPIDGKGELNARRPAASS